MSSQVAVEEAEHVAVERQTDGHTTFVTLTETNQRDNYVNSCKNDGVIFTFTSASVTQFTNKTH